jgi:orotidine-5'-phosphate decarboxylase
MEDQDKKIIYAIDGKNAKEINEQLDEFSRLSKGKKYVYALKIGQLPILSEGLQIIKEIKKKTDLNIICDLKLADAPFISVEIAQKVLDAGSWGIVVQGFVGGQVLSQIISEVPELKIFLVTEMSHDNDEYKGLTYKNLKKLIDIALKCKVWAVIGPGNREKRISKIKRRIEKYNSDVKIAAAGIGAQGGNAINALKAGSDFLIVGREFPKVIQDILKKIPKPAIDEYIKEQKKQRFSSSKVKKIASYLAIIKNVIEIIRKLWGS